MSTQPRGDVGYLFRADFYTPHRVIGAELVTPEPRLTDHLNSSLPIVDVRAMTIVQRGGINIELARSASHLLKSFIIFVVPLSEPSAVETEGNPHWQQRTKRRCRMGATLYQITGNIHTEPLPDPRAALRALDQQFVPVTEVTLSQPDGTAQDYPVIIVNRLNLDMLALSS
jgi:hypothetical protein